MQDSAISVGGLNILANPANCIPPKLQHHLPVNQLRMLPLDKKQRRQNQHTRKAFQFNQLDSIPRSSSPLVPSKSPIHHKRRSRKNINRKSPKYPAQSDTEDSINQEYPTSESDIHMRKRLSEDPQYDRYISDDLNHRLSQLEKQGAKYSRDFDPALASRRHKEMEHWRMKLSLEEQEMEDTCSTYISIGADLVEGVCRAIKFSNFETHGLSNEMETALNNGKFRSCVKQYCNIKTSTVAQNPVVNFLTTFASISIKNHLSQKRKQFSSNRKPQQPAQPDPGSPARRGSFTSSSRNDPEPQHTNQPDPGNPAYRGSFTRSSRHDSEPQHNNQQQKPDFVRGQPAQTSQSRSFPAWSRPNQNTNMNQGLEKRNVSEKKQSPELDVSVSVPSCEEKGADEYGKPRYQSNDIERKSNDTESQSNEADPKNQPNEVDSKKQSNEDAKYQPNETDAQYLPNAADGRYQSDDAGALYQPHEIKSEYRSCEIDTKHQSAESDVESTSPTAQLNRTKPQGYQMAVDSATGKSRISLANFRGPDKKKTVKQNAILQNVTPFLKHIGKQLERTVKSASNAKVMAKGAPQLLSFFGDK